MQTRALRAAPHRHGGGAGLRGDGRPRRAQPRGWQQRVQGRHGKFLIWQQPGGEHRFHGVARAAPQAAQAQMVALARRPVHPPRAAAVPRPAAGALRTRPPGRGRILPTRLVGGDPASQVVYSRPRGGHRLSVGEDKVQPVSLFDGSFGIRMPLAHHTDRAVGKVMRSCDASAPLCGQRIWDNRPVMVNRLGKNSDTYPPGCVPKPVATDAVLRRDDQSTAWLGRRPGPVSVGPGRTPPACLCRQLV